MGTLRYGFERRLAGVVVSIVDPRAMFAMVDNPAVAPVAAEADERLRRVIDALGRSQEAV